MTINSSNIISKYAGKLHREINNALRKDEINSKLKNYINLLDDSLKTLKPYNNKKVYRYESIISVDWDIISIWYKKYINHVICRPDYLSTYKRKPSKNPINLIITTDFNSNCIDIEPIIKIKEPRKATDENECLFQRSTFFRIQNIDDSSQTIYLKETKERSNLIFTKNKIFNDIDIKGVLQKDSSQINPSFSEKGLI